MIFLAFVGVFAGVFASMFILPTSLFVKITLGICFVSLFALSFSKIKFFSFRKVAILITLCSLLVGFCYSTVKIKIYNSNLVDDRLDVTGVVTDKIKAYDTCKIVVLKNISDESGKLSGKMQLTIYAEEAENIECGSRLYFTADVKSYALTKNGTVNASPEKTGVKYFASVNYNDVQVEKGSPNLFENIRISSRNLILENTKNSEIGDLIYSVLFGDKTYLTSETYNIFSLSGTAHLLAVSGLHVGFIVIVILFLLGLFKLGKLPKLITICTFLVLYNILCGFSSSILRASIMTVFLLLSYLFGEKYDALTSLGLAGLIILIANPLIAFDLGFQLSFGSVFGIICFSSKLSAFFEKIKIPSVLAQAMAICVASTIGTLPFTAISFNKLAYIGILSNILVIPVFGVIYSVTFVIFLLTLIFPALAKAYVISEVGFVIIYKICQVFALVMPLRITRVSFALLLFYPLSMFVTEFAFIMEKIKKHLSVILLSCICLTLAISLVPRSLNKTVFAKLETNANILINNSGECLIVSQNFDSYEIEKAVDYLYKNNLETSLVGIVVTDKAEDLKDVYTFADKHTTKIYITRDNVLDVSELLKRENIKILGDGASQIAGFTAMLYDKNFDGGICAVSIDFDDFYILFLNNVTSSDVEFLNTFIPKVDICVCNTYKKSYNNLNIDMKKFIVAKSSVDSAHELTLTNSNANIIYFLNNKSMEEKDEIC